MRMRVIALALVAAGLAAAGPAQAADGGANGRIVYADSNGIFTINPDGTGKAGPLAYRGYGPAWSPDGTKIAFVGPDVELGQHLYVMDADGRNLRPVVAQVPYDQPSWSPDGTRIAYTAYTSNGRDILTVDAATGGNVDQLTTDGTSEHPDWGRDGRIAFKTMRYGRHALITMDANGANSSVFVTSSSVVAAPDWRDGLLAWTSNAAGTLDVYVDGRRVTAHAQYEANPVQSPDGSLVAFEGWQGAGEGIYLAPIGGGTATKLVDAGGPFDWHSVPAPTPRRAMLCC